ncbi:MAG: photosystem II protein PsbQ [Cyanobacteria bacterium P01_C01_bin.120]
MKIFGFIKQLRWRSLTGVILALVATCLVGCGGAQVSGPATYTNEQLAQIEILAPRATELRVLFPELEEFIQNKDWVNISSFIHGPLGELRVRLNRLAIRLSPPDTKQAKYYAEEVAKHLEKLDAAAGAYNQVEAGNQYRQALDDLDAFIALIPGQTA